MRRLLACALVACALPGSASAGRGLLIGVADDSLKWNAAPQTQLALGYVHNLGLDAMRVTVPWQPGETRLPVAARPPVDRMILATWRQGLRVVLAVYGAADQAPQTDDDRAAYCTFVGSLLKRYPGVNDAVIWNEPNSSRFWLPQYGPSGESVGPASYERLLARCWDTLHAIRPSVNVIAASAPRGDDRPGGSHSPVTFYRQLGQAYRDSGRTRPIFDTVGHNPYPSTNAERPWTQHPDSNTIGEGDYGRLISVLAEAFGGTGQPLPGQGRVSIWYLEQGFQTTIDPAKAGLYRGVENVPRALPPLLVGSSQSMEGPAPDQATQLRDALELAYCQPGVGAFFNFELADEPDLSGWQSGLLWADLSPKPSYWPFKTAVAAVETGHVDCSRFGAGPLGLPAPPPQQPERSSPPVFAVK